MLFRNPKHLIPGTLSFLACFSRNRWVWSVLLWKLKLRRKIGYKEQVCCTSQYVACTIDTCSYPLSKSNPQGDETDGEKYPEEIWTIVSKVQEMLTSIHHTACQIDKKKWTRKQEFRCIPRYVGCGAEIQLLLCTVMYRAVHTYTVHSLFVRHEKRFVAFRSMQPAWSRSRLRDLGCTIGVHVKQKGTRMDVSATWHALLLLHRPMFVLGGLRGKRECGLLDFGDVACMD